MTAPTATQALCPSFIGAKRMRVTLVDGCGRPIYGPKSQCTSSGFVSVEVEPEVEEGDDQSQKTAGGEQCITAKGPDIIKWWNLSIEFCQVDPDMWLIMNRTWKPVTNADRTIRTGMRPALDFSDQLGFALELWPKAAGGASAVCDPTKPGNEDFFVSGYFLLPYCLGNAPDSFTLENEPTTFTLKARTKTGSLWGKGPYDVTRDAAGNPAPLLDYIDPGFDVPAWGFKTSGQPDTFHIEVVTVKPPDAHCGAQELYNEGATKPQITVDEGATTRTATLTVTNWDAIGKAGTVNWGDGTIEAVPAASGGEISHEYAPDQDGTEQTVTFNAGNGSAPVSAAFTPSTPPTVTGVTIDGPKEATVGGQDIDLTATAKLSDNTSKTVTKQATWNVSDTSLATVTKGVLHPVKAGEVTVNAVYADKKSNELTVTINPAPVTKLTVSPEQGNVNAGDPQSSVALTATATTSQGDSDVTADAAWETEPADPKITVDAGVVTAAADHAGGDVTVKATYQGKSDTATITVNPRVLQAIDVTPAQATLTLGDTTGTTFTAMASYNWGDGQDVTGDTTFAADPNTGITIAGATVTAADPAKDGDTSTLTGTYQGKTDTAALTIQAAPAQQQATPQVAPHPRAKRGVALTLDDAPAGDLTVDWGDGTQDTVQGAGPHQHTYSRDGAYTIHVTDAAGNPVTQRQVQVPFTTPNPHDGQ